MKSWHKLRFGNLDIHKHEDNEDDYVVTVEVYLDDIDPKAIQVQLYADPEEGTEQEIHVMEIAGNVSRKENGYLYQTHIHTPRPVTDYTPRIVPYFDGAMLPMECARILWYE